MDDETRSAIVVRLSPSDSTVIVEAHGNGDSFLIRTMDVEITKTPSGGIRPITGLHDIRIDAKRLADCLGVLYIDRTPPSWL